MTDSTASPLQKLIVGRQEPKIKYLYKILRN